MTLPNDEIVNRELTIEELETIAAGGFWSSLKHIAHEVGHIAGEIGVDAAIGLCIVSSISVVFGGSATQRKSNLN